MIEGDDYCVQWQKVADCGWEMQEGGQRYKNWCGKQNNDPLKQFIPNLYDSWMFILHGQRNFADKLLKDSAEFAMKRLYMNYFKWSPSM